MKLASKPIVTLLSIWMAFCLAGSALGQSLGDLARQQRAKKNQVPPKGGKVYTNSDIPPAALSGAPPAELAADEKNAAKPAADGTKPAKAEEKSPADLEKEYRDRYAKLKENQDLEDRKLDVMQRELNLMQQQVYADPNVALQQQYSRDEINKRTADIETQKAAAEKAKQAVADFEEELRTKGLPAGWAR